MSRQWQWANRMERRAKEVDSANRLKQYAQGLLREGSPQSIGQVRQLTTGPAKAEALATYAQRLRANVRDGLLGSSTPKPKIENKSKKKSLWDKTKGAVGDVVGEAGELAGETFDTGVKVLDAPRAHVGAPAFGILTGLNKSETYTDPKTGRKYKKSASFKDIGESLVEAVQHPVRAYEKGKESTELYKADPNKNFVWRALTDVASDPLSFAGGPAAKRIGMAAGSKLGPKVGPKVARVVQEAVDSGGPGIVIGANVGASAEQEYGEEIPGWNKMSPKVRSLIAAVGGGAVGGKAYADMKGGKVGLSTKEVGGPEDAADLRGRTVRPLAEPDIPEVKLEEPDVSSVEVPQIAGVEPPNSPPGAPDVGGPTPSPEPTPSPLRLIDLPEIQPKELSRWDTWTNTLRRMFNMPEEDTIATPALRQRKAMRYVAESQANRLSTIGDAIVRESFELDARGRISTLPGAPTVQDVAARWQTYRPLLTPEQVDAMDALREMTAPYRELLREVGADEHLGSRTDIDAEGFYLPRGNAAKEGSEAALKVTGRSRGGRKGFEKSADFESMMQGLDAGYEYAPLADALRSYATDAANKAIDQHVANYFTKVTDETGVRVGQTPADRMPMQLREEYEAAKRAAESLTGRLATAEKRAGIKSTADELSSTLERQMTGGALTLEAALKDVDTVNRAISRAQRRIVELRQRGGKYTEQASRLQAELDEAQLRLDGVAPRYKKALEDARQTPREQGGIALNQLSGWTFPDHVANAANKYLEQDSPIFGRGANVQRTVVALNAILRGLRASLDASFMGIQGILGAATDPVGYGHALKVAWQASADPQALGKYLRDFDAKAAQTGRLTSADWARRGKLHIGGAQTEFAIGPGIPGKVRALTEASAPKTGNLKLAGKGQGGLNPFRGSNRMFGYFGDTFRLELADHLQEVWAKKGLAMTDENIAHLGNQANLATGWSPNTFAGDVGQLAQFAPRFFQSQLEMITKAVSDGGIEGQVARRMLLKMVGAATVLTVAANEAGGRPISYKDMFDPENPNFLRFRVKGQDVSLLGPWASLAKGLIRSVSPVSPKALVTGDVGNVLRKPDPKYLLRSKSSPVLGMAWDIISGETFIGEDARNPEYFLRSLLPFSVAEVGRDSLTNTAIGMTGIKASPISPTENLDRVSKAKFGANFYDLEPHQREEIKEEHPDLWARAVEHGNSQRQRAEALRVEFEEQQTLSDQLLLSGEITREDWAAQMRSRRDELRFRQAEIYGDKKPSDKTPRERYFKAIDSFTDQTGAVDWESVDRWLTEQPKADQEYIERNLGLGGTELTRKYRELTRQYYELPRYRGYTSDEASAIDAVVQEARNIARGDSLAAKLGALRKVGQRMQVDPEILSGARRVFLGLITETNDRAKWRKAHPESALFLGRGTLTEQDIEALS